MVLASTIAENTRLWIATIREDPNFPQEAIDYVDNNYCNKEQAEMFMECYACNFSNLHQTTTSRNEGSHAAYRSKTNTIPKLTEAYERRRIYRRDWITRLRSNAIRARNRIPLDIQHIPELQEIAGKISNFALQQIREQVMLANKEMEVRGCRTTSIGACRCHVKSRYRLPCVHEIPVDGSPVKLEQIAPLWLLDNWNEESIDDSTWQTNLSQCSLHDNLL